MLKNLKLGLCIPTLNAGDEWPNWLDMFLSQNIKADVSLVIDSASNDQTVSLAKVAGLVIHQIDRASFNHGATRQLGVSLMPDVDVVVFLTQDAILATNDSITNLVSVFENSSIGAAYGRQLPRKTASYIEAHSRVFSYPDKSRINSFENSKKLGIKAAFISNSFAAYRSKALEEVGGFPLNTILGEDTYVAAKMLLHGWNVAYCSDAVVYHSHDYSYLEEFRRYFDIGVFHSRERWFRDELGQAEGEGMRYVKSELKYLLTRNILLIPSAFLRTVFKLLGYRFGLSENNIPLKIRAYLSMHKGYWAN